MKDNKSKNIVSILMVVALLFLCVGITYTALTYINSSDDNTVTTGRISMNYTEPSNALELVNALPMSDEEGLNQTNFFEFTVTSNATTNQNDDIGVTIPYEINISDIAIDSDKTLLPKDKIKVVLTKVVDGLEEQVMEPIKISALSSSTLNTGSLKVYDTKNIHKNNNGSITTRYRLRAWIDKDFELDNTLTYQYKFRVNVNSSVGALEVKKPTLKELILGENNSNVVASGDTGLFVTSDTNDGSPSYYYKGNVENNYVKLPEKSGDTTTDALYRIVRINEDGSVRLIRNSGIDNNTYYFNPLYNNYKYMYYSESNVVSESDSYPGIMKRVNDWYAGAIEGTTLDSKVVESNFCEQAKSTWYSNSGSTLTAGSQTMTQVTNDYVPSLKCEVDRNGKGPLKMKVGLITADEAIMAGYPFYTSTQTNNTNVYLHNGYTFWTMSPAGFSVNGSTFAWYVDDYGSVNYNFVNDYSKVRTVFSLSANIKMSGKGTEAEPFEPIFQNE